MNLLPTFNHVFQAKRYVIFKEIHAYILPLSDKSASHFPIIASTYSILVPSLSNFGEKGRFSENHLCGI